MTRWLRLRMWLGQNLLAFVGVCVGLALAVLLLTPWLLTMAQSLNLLPPSVLRRCFELLEGVHWWSIQTIVCGWIFSLGSSIASFLNVVAYRLPRGRSILGRSSCPRCCQQLSAWDNFPIFGWLRNGGRCRTCRLPISARYLFVELVLGAVFLVIFLADVGTVRTIQALQFSQPELATAAIGSLIVFFNHALLLSLLFAAALFQWEKAPLPASFVVAGWALCLVWFAAFDFGIRYWQATPLAPNARIGASGISPIDWLSAGASLLVAFVLGAVLPLGRLRNSEEHRRSLDAREAAAFGWIGLFLNWQTVAAASVVAAALILAERYLRCRGGQSFAAVFLAVVVAILCARWSGFAWIQSSGRSMTIAGAGMLALTIGLSLIARKTGAELLAAEQRIGELGSGKLSLEKPIDPPCGPLID